VKGAAGRIPPRVDAFVGRDERRPGWSGEAQTTRRRTARRRRRKVEDPQPQGRSILTTRPGGIVDRSWRQGSTAPRSGPSTRSEHEGLRLASGGPEGAFTDIGDSSGSGKGVAVGRSNRVLLRPRAYPRRPRAGCRAIRRPVDGSPADGEGGPNRRGAGLGGAGFFRRGEGGRPGDGLRAIDGRSVCRRRGRLGGRRTRRRETVVRPGDEFQGG